MMEKYPWLLPIIWVLEKGASCDPVVVAEELGIPTRLARTLVYKARRLGLCESKPDVCIVRSGRSFYGVMGSLVFVARLRNRRVTGYVFKIGYDYVGVKKRILMEALEYLKGSCLAGEEPGS